MHLVYQKETTKCSHLEIVNHTNTWSAYIAHIVQYLRMNNDTNSIIFILDFFFFNLNYNLKIAYKPLLCIRKWCTYYVHIIKSSSFFICNLSATHKRNMRLKLHPVIFYCFMHVSIGHINRYVNINRMHLHMQYAKLMQARIGCVRVIEAYIWTINVFYSQWIANVLSYIFMLQNPFHWF